MEGIALLPKDAGQCSPEVLDAHARFLDAHRADMQRRAAEREAKRDELRKCLNPAYAAQCEMAKPRYLFSVKAEWVGIGKAGRSTDFSGELNIVAQNENEAWAVFCDRLQVSPSRRDCKVKIKKGKQVDPSAVTVSGDVATEEDMFPKVRLTAKRPYTSIA
jgi:hypothetical protein